MLGATIFGSRLNIPSHVMVLAGKLDVVKLISFLPDDNNSFLIVFVLMRDPGSSDFCLSQIIEDEVGLI